MSSLCMSCDRFQEKYLKHQKYTVFMNISDIGSLIQRLVQKTNKSEDQIKVMIANKVKEYEGLLTESGAAFLILKEIDDTFTQTTTYKPEFLAINKITKSHGICSVKGIIVSSSNVRSFLRKDGSVGEYTSFLLSDNTDLIRVVLWDEKTSFVESLDLKRGKTVEIINVYPKTDRNQKLELHSGRNTIIEPLSTDEEYILPEAEHIDITNIDESTSNFKIIAKIESISPERVFERSDGTEGKVINYVLRDKTGTISLAFWNKRTEKAKEIMGATTHLSEAIIEVVNPYVRKNSFEELELGVGRETEITILENYDLGLPDEYPTKDLPLIKIGEIDKESGFVRTMGIVGKVREINEFTRSNGDLGAVCSFYLIDETGEIRVVLWNEKTELINELLEYAPVQLNNFIAKLDRENEIELHSINSSSITKEGLEEIFTPENFLKNIFEIKDRMYNLTIRVKINSIGEERTYIRDDGSSATVLNVDVEDLTGKARLSVWDNEIAKIESIPEETWVEITGVRSKVSEMGLDLILSKASKVEVLKQARN